MTISSVATVGAGRMGLGIAVAYALHGVDVDVIDFKPREAGVFEALETRLRAELAEVEGQLAELGVTAGQPGDMVDRVRITPLAAADTVLAAAELVYEAVPETLDAKVDALGRVSQAVPNGIIASTTSSMLATELARYVSRPERFLNAHWLNPAYISPLVEVSHHEETDASVTDAVCDSLEGVGKVAVRLASSPGYIVPRLQALIMNEAARMVAEGVAAPEEIDKATRFGLGCRFSALGVLEFIDFGGVEILQHADAQMSHDVDRERYEVPEVIDELVAAQERGLRDGQGFFDHRVTDASAYRRGVLARMVESARHVRGMEAPVMTASQRFAASDETRAPTNRW